MTESQIRVEVVCALPRRQALRRLSLPAGSTLADALRASGLAAEFPEIDFSRANAGIWGKIAPPETILRDGDRVEVYRPLAGDPKEIRRVRAARCRK